ncbi:hypothetical protein GW17_00039964 [Ensete ventricosum]|nr:hypothetical protein GW17_00039964 [Ensete ventricosum]
MQPLACVSAGRQAILIARQCRPSNHRVARLATDALYVIVCRRETADARRQATTAATLFCLSARLTGRATLLTRYVIACRRPRHATDALCYSLSARRYTLLLVGRCKTLTRNISSYLSTHY